MSVNFNKDAGIQRDLYWFKLLTLVGGFYTLPLVEPNRRITLS